MIEAVLGEQRECMTTNDKQVVTPIEILSRKQEDCVWLSCKVKIKNGTCTQSG